MGWPALGSVTATLSGSLFLQSAVSAARDARVSSSAAGEGHVVLAAVASIGGPLLGCLAAGGVALLLAGEACGPSAVLLRRVGAACVAHIDLGTAALAHASYQVARRGLMTAVSALVAVAQRLAAGLAAICTTCSTSPVTLPGRSGTRPPPLAHGA